MSFTINIDKFNFAEKPNPQRISRDYAAEYAKFLTENTEERLETKKADKSSTLAGYGISDAYTKSETDGKIAAIVDSAPDTLNTLKELADALGKDANFATTVTEQIGKKIDKDERFNLAYVSDAGGSKVLFIGNSNDSQSVNFYSKEQTDAALENKVDKTDGLYLVKPITKKTSSNYPGGQKEWTGMSLMHSTDYSKRSDVIIPAYTSDLENDSEFVTREDLDNKVDKDERFKLAFITDAGTNKVLFIGNSNDSQGVNFYSKEQMDTKIGSIETALDSIIAIQNELIGGGTV